MLAIKFEERWEVQYNLKYNLIVLLEFMLWCRQTKKEETAAILGRQRKELTNTCIVTYMPASFNTREGASRMSRADC